MMGVTERIEEREMYREEEEGRYIHDISQYYCYEVPMLSYETLRIIFRHFGLRLDINPVQTSDHC